MNKKAKALINELQLQKHPEGGYYKEVYRNTQKVLPSWNNQTQRDLITSIYFLLDSTSFSAFHKIKQDEHWFFHNGTEVTLHQISPDGIHKIITIGNDVCNGEKPQYCVPANHWFAAEIKTPNSYALVSCIVSPGFDFNDFELAGRESLVLKFPQHKSIINKLTRNSLF